MLRLVTEDYSDPVENLAAQVRELASMIETGEALVERGVFAIVVDGAVSYAPLGNISLIEATGLLELVSRKVERDMMR